MRKRAWRIWGPVAAMRSDGPALWDDGGRLLVGAKDLHAQGAEYLIIDLQKVWYLGTGAVLGLLDVHTWWTLAGGKGIRLCIAPNALLPPTARRWLRARYGESHPSVEAAIVSLWLEDGDDDGAIKSRAA